MTKVAILNSRQSKTPVGSDPWVRNTLGAVEFASVQGWTIVSSIGLNTWEFVTWAAGTRQTPTILVTGSGITPEERSEIVRRFALNDSSVHWQPVDSTQNLLKRKSWWDARDHAVLSQAELILPVSIRPGGRLEELITSNPSIRADERYRVPYQPTSHNSAKLTHPSEFNPGLDHWGEEWLIHWTRACHGPWPGETEAAFYQDLSCPCDQYCRSGFLTLRRILTERLLRASSWRIGGGEPMVAFTAHAPRESLGLIKWRPRWSRWSFEPYGIAISRDWAAKSGIRPIKYVSEQEWRSLTNSERPFSHRIGRDANIWPAEREWRCAGNIDLTMIPESAIRVLVRTRSEAEELAGASPFLSATLFPD